MTGPDRSEVYWQVQGGKSTAMCGIGGVVYAHPEHPVSPDMKEGSPRKGVRLSVGD